jgi:hypothetical protein
VKPKKNWQRNKEEKINGIMCFQHEIGKQIKEEEK